MIKKIKKNNLIAALILVIILYHSFAYILVYFPAKFIIKKATQESILTNNHGEQLITLAFEKSKLKANKYHFIWEEENQEFKYENHLYDVKCKVVRGDSVYYTCYLDDDENLLDKIFEEISEHSKNDKSRTEFFSLTLIGLYFEEINHLVFYSDTKSTLYYQRVEKNNFNFISDIPTPPPRFII